MSTADESRGLRLLLWGDGRWAGDTARRLADDGHTLVGVVLRRHPSDDALAQAARALGAPVLQPVDPHAPDVIAALAALRPDLMLSVSYDRLLRAPALALAPLGALNVHAGLLPRYRGRHPINRAIANGEREIGVTVHCMDETIHTGDVVAQEALPVGEDDDYGTMLARVVALAPSLAAGAVTAMALGTAVRRAQTRESATSCGASRPLDEWIDWSQPATRVRDVVRAIARPGPGARTSLDGESLRIWRAAAGPPLGGPARAPGRVVACGNKGAVIVTGNGTLLVTEATVDGADGRGPAWRLGKRLDSGRGLALPPPASIPGTTIESHAGIETHTRPAAQTAHV